MLALVVALFGVPAFAADYSPWPAGEQPIASEWVEHHLHAADMSDNSSIHCAMPTIPPRGTTTCRQEQVLNSRTNQYEWRQVCQ